VGLATLVVGRVCCTGCVESNIGCCNNYIDRALIVWRQHDVDIVIIGFITLIWHCYVTDNWIPHKFEIGPSKKHGSLIAAKRAWASPSGQNGDSPLCLEIGTKNQIFLVNLKSGALFRLNWFNSCIDSLFAGMTPTMRKNQVHCPGVMQWCVCSSFMSAALLVCWGKLRNLRADCSTVGLHCITIPWQWIFACWLQVTVVGLFAACMRVLNAGSLMQGDSEFWSGADSEGAIGAIDP